MEHFLKVGEENVFAAVAHNKINVFHVISHDKVIRGFLLWRIAADIFFY